MNKKIAKRERVNVTIIPLSNEAMADYSPFFCFKKFWPKTIGQNLMTTRFENADLSWFFPISRKKNVYLLKMTEEGEDLYFIWSFEVKDTERDIQNIIDYEGSVTSTYECAIAYDEKVLDLLTAPVLYFGALSEKVSKCLYDANSKTWNESFIFQKEPSWLGSVKKSLTDKFATLDDESMSQSRFVDGKNTGWCLLVPRSDGVVFSIRSGIRPIAEWFCDFKIRVDKIMRIPLLVEEVSDGE